MKLLALLLVAVVGCLNLLVAIPAGYALGLSAWPIYLATVAGSVAGTVALVFVGDRLTPWFNRAVRRLLHRPEPAPNEQVAEPSATSRRMRAIAERHGAIGLGLIAPFTIGGFAGALLGVATGIPKVSWRSGSASGSRSSSPPTCCSWTPPSLAVKWSAHPGQSARAQPCSVMSGQPPSRSRARRRGRPRQGRHRRTRWRSTDRRGPGRANAPASA
jgi:uncharacterized membrane protein